MPSRSKSQQQFLALKQELHQIIPLERTDLSESFGAFCCWLEKTHPRVITRAEEIASDIRLWRDCQDVLRKLWAYIYQH